MDPLTIAALAFIGTKAAETVVGKVTEVGLEKANHLRGKIWQKLRGNSNAEIALQAAQGDSKPDLEAVADFLKEAMREDAEFAEEIKALAQEVDKEKEEGSGMMQHNYGDHATNYQTDVNANTSFIGANTSFVGGTHHHHSPSN